MPLQAGDAKSCPGRRLATTTQPHALQAELSPVSRGAVRSPGLYQQRAAGDTKCGWTVDVHEVADAVLRAAGQHAAGFTGGEQSMNK